MRTTRISDEQPGELRPVVGKQRRRARLVEQVDQPADRPVDRRVDGAGEPADDEQQDERPLRLLGEIEDEAPGVVRQHLAVGVVERDRSRPRSRRHRLVAEARLRSSVIPALQCRPARMPSFRRDVRPAVVEQEAAGLPLPELGIEAALGDQLVVRPFLDDAAVVHDDQPVHRRDGRQPVRDGDHGLAFHQPVEVLLDRRLDLRIERRGRLVEDQDRRVLQHDAGDRDALALAAGQLDAALADMRVEALAALRIGERRR